jgi:hypothetical protein
MNYHVFRSYRKMAYLHEGIVSAKPYTVPNRFDERLAIHFIWQTMRLSNSSLDCGLTDRRRSHQTT